MAQPEPGKHRPWGQLVRGRGEVGWMASGWQAEFKSQVSRRQQEPQVGVAGQAEGIPDRSLSLSLGLGESHIWSEDQGQNSSKF